MADPRALRNIRLANEYEELQKINGSIIEIIPVGTHPPYDKYTVIFHIRTIISPAPTFRDQTICTLTLPPNYPEGAPTITANQTPYPWHINWFRDGRWCLGHWNPEESLVNYLYRCARTLQFDPEIANPNSVANGDAVPFWNANKNNRRIIPCDMQILPTPGDGQTIKIVERIQQPRITILPQKEKPRIVIKRN